MKYKNTTLTEIIGLLSVIILLSACEGSKESSVEKKRPNIVFIMSDDHAFQAISAYGSKINKTPSIDRLADEGMVFNRGYVTNSICGPSRAVLMTGKFSHVNGFVDNTSTFDGSQQTFPKILQKAGYLTGMFGKWHLGSEPTGFDYWSVLPGQGDYYYPTFITMGERAQEDGYVTDIITDKALGWLDTIVNKVQPFAIMIHHKGPHRTWMPPIRHLNTYDDIDIPEPETLFDNYETREGTADSQEMSIKDHLTREYDLFLDIGMKEKGDWGNNYLNSQASKMTEKEIEQWENAYRNENEEFAAANLEGDDLTRWKYQRYIKNYLRVIAGVDENVGRVLDYLKEKGLDDNTLVVYTSDQGFYLGDHGWYDKRWMYEESFRTPLLMKMPGKIKAGLKNAFLVQNIDYAPTILDVAGIEIPEDMQGRSLKPLFDGNKPDNWRESLYYHYYEYPGVHAVKRHNGIMKNNFKLIHFYHDIDKWEFYDLSKDPNELSNQYEKPEFKVIIQNLKKDLNDLQIQYGDTVKSTFSPPKPVVSNHKAKAAKITFNSQPHERYDNSKETALTDGLFTPTNKYFGSLEGYLGFNVPADFTLDLGASEVVSSINIHAYQRKGTWIHFPTKIEIYGGNNRDKMDKIAELSPESSSILNIDKIISIDFASTKVQYLKIKITNKQTIEVGDPGAGNKAWLFFDEVIVN